MYRLCRLGEKSKRWKRQSKMRTLIRYSTITLCLLIFVSVLSCGKGIDSKCQSKKIQLLLEDVFKRDYYYPTFSSPKPLYDPLRPNYKFNEPPDSSKYFVYLYSSNLIIPEKEFYLHWYRGDLTYPDSVKLRVADNPILKNKYSHKVGIGLEEVNEDTTRLKIYISYGTPNNIAINEGTISYSFDENNCKWIVLDSTIIQY